MTKDVNGRNVCHFTNFKNSSHPDSTNEDLIDYVKLIARKKPKMLVIHKRTNDLPNI